MIKQILLVVVAHPDDEILGMGGTLLKLSKEGNAKLHVLFLSLGEASRLPSDANEARRKRQAQRVASEIGATIHFTENFPDNAFDSVPLLRIIQAVEPYLTKIRPSVVFTHHGGDLNIDHRLTAQAVFTACRPSNQQFVQRMYSFEILSSTEWQEKKSHQAFLPNVYINIEKQIQKKIELLGIYRQEMNPFPFPRSREGVETLARFRGMECGVTYAEAFELIREIQR